MFNFASQVNSQLKNVEKSHQSLLFIAYAKVGSIFVY